MAAQIDPGAAAEGGPASGSAPPKGAVQLFGIGNNPELLKALGKKKLQIEPEEPATPSPVVVTAAEDKEKDEGYGEEVVTPDKPANAPVPPPPPPAVPGPEKNVEDDGVAPGVLEVKASPEEVAMMEHLKPIQAAVVKQRANLKKVAPAAAGEAPVDAAAAGPVTMLAELNNSFKVKKTAMANIGIEEQLAAAKKQPPAGDQGAPPSWMGGLKMRKSAPVVAPNQNAKPQSGDSELKSRLERRKTLNGELERAITPVSVSAPVGQPKPPPVPAKKPKPVPNKKPSGKPITVDTVETAVAVGRAEDLPPPPPMENDHADQQIGLDFEDLPLPPPPDDWLVANEKEKENAKREGDGETLQTGNGASTPPPQSEAQIGQSPAALAPEAPPAENLIPDVKSDDAAGKKSKNQKKRDKKKAQKEKAKSERDTDRESEDTQPLEPPAPAPAPPIPGAPKGIPPPPPPMPPAPVAPATKLKSAPVKAPPKGNTTAPSCSSSAADLFASIRAVDPTTFLKKVQTSPPKNSANILSGKTEKPAPATPPNAGAGLSRSHPHPDGLIRALEQRFSAFNGHSDSESDQDLSDHDDDGEFD